MSTTYTITTTKTITSTVFVCGNPFAITVDVTKAALCVDKIQILAGLVYALRFDHSDAKSLSHGTDFVCEGDSMINTSVFTWTDDVISQTWKDGYDNATGQVTERTSTFNVKDHGHYISIEKVLVGEGEYPVVLTFKDAQLESIDGEAAVTIGTTGNPVTRLWFRRNKCFNAARPDLPASIIGDDSSLHNESGSMITSRA